MQDEHYLIDRELVEATVKCFDRTWSDAELVVDMAGASVNVSLRPVDRSGVGVPSDEVYEAVGKLVHLHRIHATGLQQAVYRFRLKQDGKWSYVIDFVYPP
jgi:hypothetical protein